MNSILKYGSVQGTSRPFLGVGLMIFGVLVEMLYIPAFTAMIKKGLLKLSCYKIMFCLGMLDMFATLICSILSGFLFFKGAVFCDYPNLIYVSGFLGLSSWMMLSAFTVLLVINRVSNITCPHTSDLFFHENRTWVICVLPVLYGLFFMFFTPSVCFNSTIMAWIGDPGIRVGHVDDYSNYLQTYHNFVFVFSVVLLYTIYCAFITKQQMGVNVSAGKQVFIQSSIICFFNCTTAIVYISLFFVEPHPIVVIFGELSWSVSHACPAFIYITLNRTIRREIMSWFSRNKHKTSDYSISRSKVFET